MVSRPQFGIPFQAVAEMTLTGWKLTIWSTQRIIQNKIIRSRSVVPGQPEGKFDLMGAGISMIWTLSS
jgi:hypothetical protein